jgi:predicted RNA-binding protein
MKYWSEITKSFYDSEKACLEAEFKVKEAQNLEKIRKEREAAQVKERQEKLAAERKARATEVENARKAMVAAQKKYQEVFEAFVKDYKTYHLSLTGEDAKDLIPSLFDIFNPFLFDIK